MNDIQGPLEQRAQENADRWCTNRNQANEERDMNSRIAAALTITGDEYPRQGLVHAWNAVAAARKWYELLLLDDRWATYQ